eukprot:6512312-Ditylum_brightwellii.AAC.1
MVVVVNDVLLAVLVLMFVHEHDIYQLFGVEDGNPFSPNCLQCLNDAEKGGQRGFYGASNSAA